MSSLSSSDALKALAGFVLPDSVLDYFEVVNVKETTVLIDPDAKDRKGLYGKELEIYLDELDNQMSDMSGATCNGFQRIVRYLTSRNDIAYTTSPVAHA